MKCQKCRLREATLHATQYVNGEECSVHLCLECAVSAGFDPTNPMSIGEVMGNVSRPGTLLARAFEDAPRGGDAARCPSCGLALSDARESGRLGCPACYEAFRATVSRALGLGREGRAPYRGKIPPMADLAEERAAKRARLSRLLAEAVAREQYEEAARLRDALASLASSGGGEGKA